MQNDYKDYNVSMIREQMAYKFKIDYKTKGNLKKMYEFIDNENLVLQEQ